MAIRYPIGPRSARPAGSAFDRRCVDARRQLLQWLQNPALGFHAVRWPGAETGVGRRIKTIDGRRLPRIDSG